MRTNGFAVVRGRKSKSEAPPSTSGQTVLATKPADCRTGIIYIFKKIRVAYRLDNKIHSVCVYACVYVRCGFQARCIYMHSAYQLRQRVCLSVCLSGCPSQPVLYQNDKTYLKTFSTIWQPHHRSIRDPLRRYQIPRGTPSSGAIYTRGWGKIGDFQRKWPISRKRCEIGLW